MEKKANAKAGQVADRTSLHRYRTEIPNIVEEMDLSVYAFRLYVRLKRVAGDGGKCFYSTRELAEQCKMSMGAISKAKQELVDADLIQIDRAGDWKRDNITLIDMWPANFAHFATETDNPARSPHEQTPEEPCSPNEQEETLKEPAPVHVVNTSVHTVNAPVHVVNTKEEPIKKEPKKEETKENTATQPQADVDFMPDTEPTSKEKTLTPQQAMYGAICEALGWDYHTITRDDQVKIAQAVKILSKANYTVEDIRRFMVEVWFNDWRWEKNQQRPTLSQLRQDIGKLRAVTPEHVPRNGNQPTSKADRNVANVHSVFNRIRNQGVQNE